MSSGFITEKDAGLERQKRQEEWEKVRQPSGNWLRYNYNELSVKQLS